MVDLSEESTQSAPTILKEDKNRLTLSDKKSLEHDLSWFEEKYEKFKSEEVETNALSLFDDLDFMACGDGDYQRVIFKWERQVHMNSIEIINEVEQQNIKVSMLKLNTQFDLKNQGPSEKIIKGF